MKTFERVMKHSKSLIGSKGAQQSLLMVFGNLASTAISAISLIIISNILGPSKFGEFSVGFAIVLILIRINDVGLNAALLKYINQSENQKDINSYFSAALRSKVVVSIILIVLGLLLYQPLLTIFKLEYPKILLVSLTLGLVTTYYEHLLYSLQALHRFFQSVLMNTMQATTKAATAFLLLATSIKSADVIFSLYVLAPLVPVLCYRLLVPKWLKIQFFNIPAKYSQKMFSMARHSAIAFISAGIIENIDVLFVQSYLDSYDTGILGGVSKIAMLFTLIAYSLSNVLNPRVARYRDKKNLEPYIKKAFLLLLGIIGLAMITLPLAPLLIRFTIGTSYVAGISALRVLIISTYLMIASVPFIALFYSYDNEWYFSVSGICQLLIIISGNLLFVPQYGLIAAAWTRLAARLFLFLFTSLLGIYIYHRKYR